MKIKSIPYLFFLSINLFLFQAHADPIIINNNVPPQAQAPAQMPPQGYGPQQQTAQSTCPPANQNNIYDPRVPPAGVYHSQSGTVYTTGEKKPYIVDNNCNSSSTPTVQPYINLPSPPQPTH